MASSGPIGRQPDGPPVTPPPLPHSGASLAQVWLPGTQRSVEAAHLPTLFTVAHTADNDRRLASCFRFYELHSLPHGVQGTNARPGSRRLITRRASIDRGSTNLALQKSFSAATRLSNSGGSGLLSARQSQTPRSFPDGRLQKAVLPGLPAL